MPCSTNTSKDVERDRRGRGAVILERVEGRLAILVERDDFAVDDRFVRQLGEPGDDVGILGGEVLVVARAEVNFAAGLESDGAIAVEL
jgi:hypothetical protein